MSGFEVVDYDIPAGTCAAYYPECNPLIPLGRHAEESKTPAAKSVPVRVSKGKAPISALMRGFDCPDRLSKNS